MKTNYLTKIFTIFFLSIIITSCSNENNTIELQPEKNKVYGDIDDFIITDKPATLVFNEDYSIWTIKVPLKLTEPIDFKPENYNYKFKVSLKNKDGDRINGVSDFEMRDRRSKKNLTPLNDFKKFLSKSKGEEIILELESQYETSELTDAFKANLKNLGLFRIRCNVYKKKEDRKKSNEISENTDWNKVLDDYEEYFDEYIKFIKKANEGDMSALNKFPELMKKAEKIGTNLEKAQGSNALNSSQISRLNKIQQKLMKASIEMQKIKN